MASSVTLCQNECLHSLDPSWGFPGQYIFKPFCIRMLLLLCGSLPLTPLVWASLVTGATGCGVAFPQKSSASTKCPILAGDFISFGVCGQLQRKCSFPAKKKWEKRKWSHKDPLAARKSSFAAAWLGPLLIPSPSPSSISPLPPLPSNPNGLQIVLSPYFAADVPS